MSGSAKLSLWAIASLILGILSFLLFILIPLAIITGLVALGKIRSSQGSLKGSLFAFSGVISGFAALAFAGALFMNYEMHYRSFKVPTASMAPTIKAKERIMVDLGAYAKKRPSRGDIVVYEMLDKGRRRMMCKRIAGLPGEEVDVGGGHSVRIPDNFYYLLGDNPSMSFDSRQHGPIDGRDIKGRYIFSYRGLPIIQFIKLLVLSYNTCKIPMN